jgi:hypothetical protein
LAFNEVVGIFVDSVALITGVKISLNSQSSVHKTDANAGFGFYVWNQLIVVVMRDSKTNFMIWMKFYTILMLIQFFLPTVIENLLIAVCIYAFRLYR